jgi:hypothetical protein
MAYAMFKEQSHNTIDNGDVLKWFPMALHSTLVTNSRWQIWVFRSASNYSHGRSKAHAWDYPMNGILPYEGL